MIAWRILADATGHKPTGGTMAKQEFTDKQFINHIYSELKTDIHEPMRIYGIYNRVLKMIREYLEVQDDQE